MYNTGNRGFAAAVITGGLIGVNGTAAALRPVPPFVPVSSEPKPDGVDRGADRIGHSDFQSEHPGTFQGAPSAMPPNQAPMNGHIRPVQSGPSIPFGQQQPGQQQLGRPPMSQPPSQPPNQPPVGYRQPFPPSGQQPGQPPVDGYPHNGGSLGGAPLDELNAPLRPSHDLAFGDNFGSGPVGPVGPTGMEPSADSHGTAGLRVVSEPSGAGLPPAGQSPVRQPPLSHSSLGPSTLNPADLEPARLEPSGTGGHRAAAAPGQPAPFEEAQSYRGVEEIIGSISQRPTQGGPRGGGGRRRRPDDEQASGALRVVSRMGETGDYRVAAEPTGHRSTTGLAGEITGTGGYQLVAEMTGTGGYQAVPDVSGSGGYLPETELGVARGGFQAGPEVTGSGALRAVSGFGDSTGGRHGTPDLGAPAQSADALAFGTNINESPRSDVRPGMEQAPMPQPLTTSQPVASQQFGAPQGVGSDGFLAGNVAALAAPAGPLDGSQIGALGPAEGSRGTGFYAYGEAATEVELGAPRRQTSGLYKDRSVESSLGTAAVVSQQFASDRAERPSTPGQNPGGQNSGGQNSGGLGGGQQIGGHRTPDIQAANSTAMDSSALGSLDGTLYFRRA